MALPPTLPASKSLTEKLKLDEVRKTALYLLAYSQAVFKIKPNVILREEKKGPQYARDANTTGLGIFFLLLSKLCSRRI